MSNKTTDPSIRPTDPKPSLRNESVQLLLSEHERIAQLFIENRQMGERRTSLFLTLITIAIPATAAFSQYFNAGLITPVNLATLGVLLIVGLLTFYRLVERRVMSTELLRAINRIHRYFVEHDPALAAYMAWKADEALPKYVEHRGALPGLRDVVQLLNSLLTGFLIPGTLSLFWLSCPVGLLLSIAFASGGLAWLGQQWYEISWLKKAQARADQETGI